MCFVYSNKSMGNHTFHEKKEDTARAIKGLF